MASDFFARVQKIIEKVPHYKPDAYEFVMQALWFTQKKLKRKGHLSGRELLLGIKEFGQEQFGGMVRTVFEYWGVKKTDDFGSIVFAMVENGLMSKTEEDSLQDFKDVYDFREEFDTDKRLS